MRRVEQMAEEFGQYNFNFIHYVIQKAEITDNTLTIEGANGFTIGKLIFEEQKKRVKEAKNKACIQRILYEESREKVRALGGVDIAFFFTDSMSHAMYYKMLGAVRSKEIPFHFLHVQNVNQVIENIYSVVKAEVE